MRYPALLFLALTAGAAYAQAPGDHALAGVDAAGAAAAQQTPSTADHRAVAPVFRTSTRNVVLDVVVRDAAGRPVSGLRAQDFAIREDGIPQAITSFAAVEPGAQSPEATPHTILLLDTLNTRFEDMAFARYAVGRLLHESGAVLDHPTALYVLGGEGLRVAQTFTRDPDALDAALRAVPADLPWLLSKNDADTAIDRINRSTLALTQIASANYGVGGHKNLIWISPGFPMYSPLNLSQPGRKQLEDKLRVLSSQLLESRITIDSVDPRGVFAPPITDLPVLQRIQSQSAPDDFRTRIAALAAASRANFYDIALPTLAKQTGGNVYFGRNDIDVAIAASIRDGGTYYSIAYKPSRQEFHDEFRRVQASVLRTAAHPVELQAHTRDGYYALADDPAMLAERRSGELSAALFASPLAYRAIPIVLTEAQQLAVHAGEPALVAVRLLIPTSALTWQPDAQGLYECSLMLASAERAGRGKWRQNLMRPFQLTLADPAKAAEGQTVSVEFRLPYSTDQFRFVVQDESTGRLGSSEYTLPPRAAARP